MKKALTPKVTAFTWFTFTPVWAEASSDSPMLARASPYLDRLMK